MSAIEVIVERENKAIRVMGLSVLDAGYAGQQFVLKHRGLMEAGWLLVFYPEGSPYFGSSEQDAVRQTIGESAYDLPDEAARLINHSCPACGACLDE